MPKVETKAPDQNSREIIAKELRQNVWVEAGAGSGKTTELISRLVALVVEEGVSLSNIAAITFTRKAAAELKSRAQQGLEQAYAESKPGKGKERLAAALEEMDALFAETIHSFCMQLLRERPLEAGVPPGFDLIDAGEDDRLHQSKLQERLDEVRGSDPGRWEELEAAGIRAGQLQEAFKVLCEHAEVRFPVTASARLKPEGLADLRASCEALREAFAGARGDDGKRGALYKALAGFARELGVRKMDNLPDFAAVAELFEKKMEDFKGNLKEHSGKGFSSVEAGTEMQRQYDDFKEHHALPFLRDWRTHVYGLVIDVLDPARTAAMEARKKLGKLNHGDLLRLACELLREHAEVRRGLAERYQHLFVDEFQDTDPIQAELMLLLTGDNGGKDWTKQKPKPGSLFVVGDPKQSIYRFRRADIAVYKQVKKIMLDAGAKEAPLTANFRSQPAICDWVNKAFKGILPEAESEAQAAFATLAPMRHAPEGYKPGVFRLDIPADVTQSKIPQAEAGAIAEFIRNAVDSGFKIDGGMWDKPELRGARYGDFMIISSKTKQDLSTYAAELDRSGIPNEVVAVDPGGAWDGLNALRAFLGALADPDDEVAIVSVLRGPFFGISDDELFKFRQNSKGFRFLGLPEDAKGPVADALRMQGECYRLTRVMQPGAAVEAILEETGFLAALNSREDGSAQVANVLAAVESVRARGLEGETFADALNALNVELDERKGENLSKTPITAESNRVRIMNLHKAKGLEARVVFLTEPAAGLKNGHPISRHIRRKGTVAEGFMPIAVSKGSYQKRILAAPAEWDDCERIERTYEQGEADRLLYVAVTRARDFLIVTRYGGTVKGAGEPLAKLYGALTAVPPMPKPAAKDKALPAAAKLTKKDAEKAAVERREGVEKASCASYGVAAVTELAHDGVELPKAAKSSGPRGLEWGTLIHRILEVFARKGAKPGKQEIKEKVVALMGPASPFKDDVEEACRLVKNVVESEAWACLLASSERYVEVPFHALLATDEIKPAGKVVLAGAMDLVYRVEGGWEIVDYKTDSVGEDSAPWVKAYRPQLMLYKRFVEAISGESVRRIGIIFVRTGETVWVR